VDSEEIISFGLEPFTHCGDCVLMCAEETFSGWEGWLAPALPFELIFIKQERGQATLPNLKMFI
jgi:hypothetical protein